MTNSTSKFIPTEADVPLPFETAVVEPETYGILDYSNLAFYDEVQKVERYRESSGFRSSDGLSHSEFEQFFDIIKFIGKDNFKIALHPVVLNNGQTIEITSKIFPTLGDVDKHFSDAVAGHRTIYLLYIGKILAKSSINNTWDEAFQFVPAIDIEQVEKVYEYKLRFASVY